jgi:peroxisomal 2,4-dienoyl-CoA reductase
LGRREDELKKRVSELASEGLTAIGIKCDVRKQEQIQEAVAKTLKEFGKIDIVRIWMGGGSIDENEKQWSHFKILSFLFTKQLLNGAAGNFLCSTEDLSANAFKTVLEIDTIGTFLATKACLEALKQTRGVVLNISATLHYTQTPYQVHASVAKAGVDAMTRHFGVELAQLYGIRVNGIAPGPIGDTTGMTKLSGGQQTSRVAQHIPLRRMGERQDIANAALYLCSDASAWVTGETIVVDGGAVLYAQPFVSQEQYEAFKAFSRGAKAKM